MASQPPAAEIAYLRRQREARLFALWRPLILAPVQGDTLVAPAAGRLFVRALSSFPGGAVATIVGPTTRTLHAPALSAGARWPLARVEVGATINASPGIAIDIAFRGRRFEVLTGS